MRSTLVFRLTVLIPLRQEDALQLRDGWSGRERPAPPVRSDDVLNEGAKARVAVVVVAEVVTPLVGVEEEAVDVKISGRV